MPSKTRRRRKSMPWSGWAKISPKGRARTVMKRKCGKKCFLGPKKSFPVCAKGTCKVNTKGLYAAYVRARQWGKKRSSYKGRSRPTMKQSTYKRVARKAKSMLKRRGALRGGKKRKRSRSRRRKRKSRSRKRKSRSRKRKSRSRKRKSSRSRKRKRSRSRKRR